MRRTVLRRSTLVPAVLAAAAITAGSGAAAQPAPELARDSLRAFLITFGPGAAVWERFGHNALWIHDPERGTDRAYHYGLFDMSEEGFLLHFLQGRMWYSMGDAPADWMVDYYRRAGRRATIQELGLHRNEIQDLQRFLEWNLLPENRVYRYDYFRDNCSTRIRDALDRVLDGRLHTTLADRPSDLTYRAQAVALTARDATLTTAMDLGLGPLSDRPITRWELAFIPMRLRDDLRDLAIERDGMRAPLVVSEADYPTVGPPDESLAEPPLETSSTGRVLGHLLLGLVLGGLFVAAGEGLRRPVHRPGSRHWTGTASRWGLGVGGTLWGVLTGVLGLVLFALWTLTDHEFAWRNENLLQANPLALALAVLVPLAVFGERRRRAAGVVALVLAGLSVLGLALHPLPLTPQANEAIIALALPVHLGLAWALHRCRGVPATRKIPSLS